jgi:pyruvate carboxylase
MKRKIAIGNQEKEVEFVRQGDKIRVTLDGTVRVLTLLQQDDGLLVLAYENEAGQQRLLRLAGSNEGDRRRLWVDGRMLTYTVVGRAAAAPAGGHGTLAAEIPAVVSDVLVQVGDMVAAGDVLLLLESMKMVIPIAAPFAGTVSELHCRQGEAVQPGVELVSLTPAASPSEKKELP